MTPIVNSVSALRLSILFRFLVLGGANGDKFRLEIFKLFLKVLQIVNSDQERCLFVNSRNLDDFDDQDDECPEAKKRSRHRR